MRKTLRVTAVIAAVLLCAAAVLLLWGKYGKRNPTEEPASSEQTEALSESKTAPLPLESEENSETRKPESKSELIDSEAAGSENPETSSPKEPEASDREDSKHEREEASKQESCKEEQESSRTNGQNSAQESKQESKAGENSQSGAAGAYFCGNPKHSCRNVQEHEAMLAIEERGCPYCGRHDCPSFYATDKHGNQEFDFSLCPKYKAQDDPTKYCPYCGKSVIVDTNHPPENACWRWPSDANCPYCGGFVPANTCHSCPPGTKFQP